MGIYLNPDNDGFQESIHSKIYVDKTGLIAYTNEIIHTEQKFICVSRPRRFGKSMTLKMLAFKIYMDMNFEGLRSDIVQMLSGGRVKINTRSFRNDMHHFSVKDDILTLLVHLGYLAYDSVKKEAFIPNKEIMEEFENAMSTGGWQEVMQVLNASEQLLQDTLSCNEICVAEGLDRAHTQAASILTYNDENSLSCAIGLAYYSARKDYRMIREFPAGHGFADVVFLPLPHTAKPALVIELKYNKSDHAAIQQIKDRNYIQALEEYHGEILLIGINYNKKNKRHSCVIEKHIS